MSRTRARETPTSIPGTDVLFVSVWCREGRKTGGEIPDPPTLREFVHYNSQGIISSAPCPSVTDDADRLDPKFRSVPHGSDTSSVGTESRLPLERSSAPGPVPRVCSRGRPSTTVRLGTEGLGLRVVAPPKYLYPTVAETNVLGTDSGEEDGDRVG